jgi:hypothetical protein
LSVLSDIPVVLFAYRRPDILQQVLECFRADNIPLLIAYLDAPRDADAAVEVAAVRDILRSITWCEFVLEESPVNLGLGVSVKRGVTATLQKYSCAIFFEDDLICVPGTYQYLSAALRRYENDPRVMSVTGWTHPRIIPGDVGANPYFDGKGECWAWGTWARAWNGMADPALMIMEECAEAGIDVEKYGTDMPKMAAEAESKNLWAVGWWYHHMRREGLCLRPPWSMIEQICWDENRSTTTTAAMIGWANHKLNICPPIPEVWPEAVEHSQCTALWRRSIDGQDAA